MSAPRPAAVIRSSAIGGWSASTGSLLEGRIDPDGQLRRIGSPFSPRPNAATPSHRAWLRRLIVPRGRCSLPPAWRPQGCLSWSGPPPAERQWRCKAVDTPADGAGGKLPRKGCAPVQRLASRQGAAIGSRDSKARADRAHSPQSSQRCSAMARALTLSHMGRSCRPITGRGEGVRVVSMALTLRRLSVVKSFETVRRAG